MQNTARIFEAGEKENEKKNQDQDQGVKQGQVHAGPYSHKGPELNQVIIGGLSAFFTFYKHGGIIEPP
jgi:hypothetical protein